MQFYQNLPDLYLQIKDIFKYKRAYLELFLKDLKKRSV